MTGTILWFKRDLRVADHPGLALAAQEGAPVLPLYLVEPDLWRQPDADARHYGFLRDCLVDLRDQLARIGLRLVIRVGEAVPVLEALRREHGITRLISHEETGNGWSHARDLSVAAWARGQGVTWEELPQSGVVRRLRGRDGWAAARDRFMAQPLAVPGPARMLDGVAAQPLPGAAALGLGGMPRSGRPGGGRLAWPCWRVFSTNGGRITAGPCPRRLPGPRPVRAFRRISPSARSPYGRPTRRRRGARRRCGGAVTDGRGRCNRFARGWPGAIISSRNWRMNPR
ncbi:deoxyribodipyrimidine photo-lyase [Seohaeicola saemankumensis]|uniref:deoxyribodipyrimidine photo-lyase n=1 Tax=Seohaeicola saemankumensis TaxID=481181 RepID=UPI0035D05C1B